MGDNLIMVFTGLLFTFIFLPLTVILNYLAKDKYRNYILLIASLIFYSYGEPRFVFVMIGSIAVNHVLATVISKCNENGRKKAARNFLILDIFANVGLLFVFKYLVFVISHLSRALGTDIPCPDIALPIGISFFTFQALSYVIDVYRGTVKAQKNPLYVALYISFFPQLVAGPIVRYSDIEDQILGRKCTMEGFAEGGRRFMLGFIKKVILANNLSVMAEEIFAMDINSTNPLILWLGSICFSLQIFYDFSGYSDMAIGLGRIFGFEFPENFDYPYISRSVTEFWRRWHISLGRWFRDYVYIPLGGSRVSVPRHILNMFIVWLLTGIWHGADYTFVLWGLMYFVLLVIEKYIVKPDKRKNVFFSVIWRIVTLMMINFGWVIFNSNWWKNGVLYCLAMLGRNDAAWVINGEVLRYCREYGVLLVAGIVFSTPVMKKLSDRVNKTKASNAAALMKPVVYGIAFLWAVSYILLGAHNPFIYFNF